MVNRNRLGFSLAAALAVLALTTGALAGAKPAARSGKAHTEARHDAKPAATKPTETKPAAAKPTAAKPTQTTPTAAKPTPTKAKFPTRTAKATPLPVGKPTFVALSARPAIPAVVAPPPPEAYAEPVPALDAHVKSSIDGPIATLAPELATAMDALDTGHLVHARELFENWLSTHKAGNLGLVGAVRYLEARCDARLGALAAADAEYLAAAQGVPELADTITAERARLALRDGRFADADALVDHLDLGNREALGLMMERVSRQLRSGRAKEALIALGRLTPAVLQSGDRARVAQLFADVRLALTGDRPAWYGQLADLWRTWPRSDAASDIEGTLLSGVGEVSAVPTSPLSLDELVDLAMRRIDAAGVRAAEPIVAAIGKRFGHKLVGLEALMAGQAMVKRKPGAVRQTLEAAAPTASEPVVRDRMWDVIARTLRQEERYDDALEVYQRIGRDAATADRRAEALLEGGRMARRMGRVTLSRWFFDRYLARHGERLDARAEALWCLGWFAWREGTLDEADNFFRLVMTETPDSTDSSGRTYAERAMYWRGRILHRRGRVDDATALWAEVERHYPLSYYAALSAAWRRRLGVDDQVTPAPAPNAPILPPRVAAFARVEDAAVPALTLVRLGFQDDARAFLRQVNKLHKLGVSGVEFLSSLYRAEGDETLAHWVVQGADPLDAPPVNDARGRWLSAFPRPFSEIVEREGLEHGIDPLVIWSIMRQESGFKTQARSAAKAHGLMQVLLPTARHVAKALLNERMPSLAKVYTAEANVHYGAAYLRHLLNRYKGNFALAFAGYNAGPGAVDKWLKRFGPIDCDEFVEEIPYAEAQGYARKVIRSYAAYTYLYGPKDAPFLHLPLKLPNAVDRQASGLAPYGPTRGAFGALADRQASGLAPYGPTRGAFGALADPVALRD